MTKEEYLVFRETRPTIALGEAILALSLYLTNRPDYDADLMTRCVEQATESTMQLLIEKHGEAAIAEMMKSDRRFKEFGDMFGLTKQDEPAKEES